MRQELGQKQSELLLKKAQKVKMVSSALTASVGDAGKDGKGRESAFPSPPARASCSFSSSLCAPLRSS